MIECLSGLNASVMMQLIIYFFLSVWIFFFNKRKYFRPENLFNLRIIRVKNQDLTIFYNKIFSFIVRFFFQNCHRYKLY